MNKMELRDAPAGLRKGFLYAKGLVAKEGAEYAATLFLEQVKREPSFVDAREYLRKLQQEIQKAPSGLSKFISDFKVAMLLFKAKSKRSKAPKDALGLIEDALAINVRSLPALTLLADTAEDLNATFICIEAMTIAHTVYPDNIDSLKQLIKYYKAEGNGAKVYEYTKILADRFPDDLSIQSDLRGAAAMATINKSWSSEPKETSNEPVEEKKTVSVATTNDKVIRSADDIETAVEELENEIKTSGGTPDIYRKLGEFYQRLKRHEDAIGCFEKALAEGNASDVSLDKLAEISRLAVMDQQIEDASDDITKNSLLDKRTELEIEGAKKRVSLFPNDTQLHYELALLYWKKSEVALALQEFQTARKNPQRRLSAQTYIGLCFAAQSQFDMAANQLETVIGEMSLMNEEKMNALYELGCVYQNLANNDKARECFQSVYQEDVSFRDIADKMKTFYS